MSTAAGALRLDRLLGNLGYGSRREILGFVRAGRVRLDGERVEAVDRKLPLSPDLPARLTVDGAPLDPLPGLVVMMHKPVGTTCSHQEAGPLVHELLPPRWRLRQPAVSPVGRLDKDTSGLLLLTDDGALLHRIISPRSRAPKRYRAVLAEPLRPDAVEAFASGTLMLSGEAKPLLPAVLEPLEAAEAYVTIMEGRYHQVRRMFAAVGNHVVALHRDLMGGLSLPGDLEAGQYRVIAREDVRRAFG